MVNNYFVFWKGEQQPEIPMNSLVILLTKYLPEAPEAPEQPYIKLYTRLSAKTYSMSRGQQADSDLKAPCLFLAQTQT